MIPVPLIDLMFLIWACSNRCRDVRSAAMDGTYSQIAQENR